jgi:hypothetical protein
MTSLKLADITNLDIRTAAQKMDLNKDGQINEADRRLASLSKEQFKGVVSYFQAFGTSMFSDATNESLEGKRVVATGFEQNKNRVHQLLRSAGAIIQKSPTAKTDIVLTANADQTSKDEKAAILNALGKANIQIFDSVTSLSYLQDIDPTFSLRDVLPEEKALKEINSSIQNWFKEYFLSIAENTDELSRVGREDLDFILNSYNEQGEFDPSAHYETTIAEFQPWYEGQYKDKYNQPIPNEFIHIIDAGWYDPGAGIGLGKTFVFDIRDAALIESSDIRD